MGHRTGGLILYLAFPPIRRGFHETSSTIGRRALGLICFNEGMFVLAKAIGFLAFSLGPVALVSVLNSTQVFYAIVYGWLLTTIAPSVLQETISRRVIATKISLAICLVAGIWLIY